MAAQNLLGATVSEVVTAILDEKPDTLHVRNPSADVIEAFVDAATETDADLPSVRLVAEERLLKDTMDDFIVASNTADLVEADVLSLRTTEEPPRSSTFVTDDRVVSLVDAGSETGGLTTDDDSFVADVVAAAEADWESADEFSLRTPGITRVERTLTDEIGSEVEADFKSALAAMETARGDGDSIDEVTLSLLVAAKNRVLLYDISKWGEDVGIASKATFSRTKTKLEDLGLIDTEKVPIDVGRPRLRLKFADERLQDAKPSELATVAQSILA